MHLLRAFTQRFRAYGTREKESRHKLPGMDEWIREKLNVRPWTREIEPATRKDVLFCAFRWVD